MSTTIELKSISKYFGSVIALKDISISVNSGEVLCLLGDNGAGKSTLIKTLAGVHQPDEGDMFLEGKKNPLRFPKRCPGPRYCNRLSGSCPGPSDECYPEFFHGP